MNARTWVVTFALLPVLIAASPQEELDRQMAEYKQAGEPVEPAEFLVGEVAAKDNAVPDLRLAAKSIDTTAPAWQEAQAAEQAAFPLTDAEVRSLKAVIDANAIAFNRLNAAMTKSAVDWQIRLSSPIFETLLPDLSPQRTLARLVMLRAKLKHQTGDDAGAAADVRRLLFISRATDQMPFLISHVVSRSIAQMATGVVVQMAPDLRVGDDAGAISAEQLQALIADLIDDAASGESMRRSILFERIGQVDTAQCVAVKKLDPRKLGGDSAEAPNLSKVTADAAFVDALIAVRYTTLVSRATEGATSWPAAKAKMPPVPAELGQREQHPLLSLLLPAMEGAIRRDYANTAQRRLAACALAVRWYAVDHDGKRAATLEELVPRYLPRLPLDPMASADQPMYYVPDARPPVLYSVGDNGMNDLGTERAVNSGAKARGQWRTGGPILDIVVQLDRPARPAPTTNAGAGR